MLTSQKENQKKIYLEISLQATVSIFPKLINK